MDISEVFGRDEVMLPQQLGVNTETKVAVNCTANLPVHTQLFTIDRTNYVFLK